MLNYLILVAVFSVATISQAEQYALSREEINNLQFGLLAQSLNFNDSDFVGLDELPDYLDAFERMKENKPISNTEMFKAMRISGYLQGMYTGFALGVSAERQKSAGKNAGKNLGVGLCGMDSVNVSLLIIAVRKRLAGIPPESLKAGTAGNIISSAFLEGNLYKNCSNK